MKNLPTILKRIIVSVSKLERNHKIITYSSLLFLTISAYFLRSNSERIKIEFATLEIRNSGMKENMFLFNKNYEKLPIAVWQKVKRGNQFIIQYVNPKYVSQFGHLFKYDKMAHVGKNNFELFPEKYAQEYNQKDLAVAITGDRLYSTDEVLDKEGNKAYVDVVKWRDIKDNKDTLIYGMVKGDIYRVDQ